MEKSTDATGGASFLRGRRVGVLIIATLLLLTCSCGGSAPKEIVLLSGRDDSVGSQRAALVNSWNLSHAVKARIVELSGSVDQQHDEMVKAAQDKNSDVDVFNLDVTWTSEFARGGYVQKLSAPPDVSGFLPGPLGTGEDQGTLYALPFNTDAGLLYVNQDVVDCPTDWTAIQADVARIAAAREPRPSAVWSGQLGEYDGLVVNVLETERSETLDSRGLFETGLPALQYAVDLLRPASSPGKVAPDALSSDENASTQALRQGKVAMTRNWPIAAQTLFATSPENPRTGRNIKACQIPGSGAVLGGQNLAVSSHSDVRSDAEEFTRYMTSCPAEEELLDPGGFAPTRMCAYDTSVRGADPFWQLVKNAVAGAGSRPQGPCYSRFSALFSSVVHRSLITGDRLPPDFLDQLQRAIDCKPDEPG